MAILCMHLNTLLAQNNISISGTVRNAAGEPLSGATVTNTRTGKGTVTSATGAFTLHGTNEKDKLRISYIGYAAQTITVGKERKLTITLKDATNELDKVVVQAYGITSDRLRTGNISKVTAADIAKQPVMNVLNVLQGLVPGADVNNTSGYASGVVKVELRGRNLINPGFSSDPLYVIDGVPLTIQDMTKMDSYFGGSVGVNQAGISGPAGGQSPLFNINPQDIESIEVLKDADATAIYGSRGAQGVILITTKRGKAGKTIIDVNASTGVTQIVKTYKMLNTQQYLAMRREALKNDGLEIDAINAPDLTVWDTTRYTNWQKELMSGGSSITANATVSGGSPFNTFRLSADYSSIKDLSTFSGGNQRASFAVNLNHQSQNRRLRIDFSSFYSASKVNLHTLPWLMTLPPNAPAMWDENGEPNYNGWAPLDDMYGFGNLLSPYESKTNMLNANMITRYEIIKGLNFRTNLGYDNIQSGQFLASPIVSSNPKYNPKGSNQVTASSILNQIIEPQLEYNGFLGIGKLNGLVGATWQNNLGTSLFLQGTGFTNDALIYSVSNAPVQAAGNDKSTYKYLAAFGRLGYNLKDRYLLNFNVRRDGSSKFGPGRQFGNFGSVGAAWIFGDEPWVKNNLTQLSFGKIRGSIGTTGGDQIGNYEFLSRWRFGQTRNSYNDVLPVVPISHLDSLIQWQVNHKAELAITVGFLRDRITLDWSWYRNRCNNQLVGFPTPLYTGFGSVLTNSPANVENKGWELVMKGHLLQGKQFNWDLSANISRNRNRLISYPNLSESPYYGKLIVGKPLNVIRLLHYLGVDPSNGNYSFEDRDGNGEIENNKAYKDDTYFFETAPPYFGGVTNTLSYKGWQLSVLFYFRKQVGVSALGTAPYPGGISNQPATILNHWEQAGDITNIPRFSTNPPSKQRSQFLGSDGVWMDASFIRLQNLALNYQLPDRISKKFACSSSNIYFRAQNLWLTSRYDGLDPETQSFGTPPMPRNLTFGFSLTF